MPSEEARPNKKDQPSTPETAPLTSEMEEDRNRNTAIVLSER